MELIIIVLAVIGVAGWWIWKEGKLESKGHPLESFTQKLDVNKDGKIDIQDAKAAVTEVKEVVTAAADVNKDGKVDVEDAKVVVEKTKKVAKKAKAKTTEAVGKVKSAVKKTTAKKTKKS